MAARVYELYLRVNSGNQYEILSALEHESIPKRPYNVICIDINEIFKSKTSFENTFQKHRIQ